MKPSDLWITPEVGQYWFDTHALTVCKVTEVTDHSVMFDGKTSVVPPLRNSFVHLWYTGLVRITSFLDSESPQPGEVWVSNETQDLVIIHPDQSGVPSKTVRILSDSSHTDGFMNNLRG
jgi:hypothetical protein